MNTLNFYNRKTANKGIYTSSYAYAGSRDCMLCLEKGHTRYSAKQALKQITFLDDLIPGYIDINICNLIIFNNNKIICDYCIADLELKILILEFEDQK